MDTLPRGGTLKGYHYRSQLGATSSRLRVSRGYRARTDLHPVVARRTGERQEGRPLYEPTGKPGNNPHLVTAPLMIRCSPFPRFNDAPWNLRSIITPYTGRNWLVVITRRATAKSPHASPGNPKPGGISEFQHDPRGRASTSSRARAGCPGIWPGNLPVLAVAVAEATAEAAADLPTDSVLHVRLKGNPTCEPQELSGGIKT